MDDELIKGTRCLPLRKKALGDSESSLHGLLGGCRGSVGLSYGRGHRASLAIVELGLPSSPPFLLQFSRSGSCLWFRKAETLPCAITVSQPQVAPQDLVFFICQMLGSAR